MSTIGLRYTALRLARLHPADRAWLLERLPMAQADALRTMGATADVQRLAHLVEAVDPPCATPVETSPPMPAPRLPAAALDRLDPHWASLWLLASEGEALEHYLADATAARAARVAESVDAIGPRLPPQLAAALSRWSPAKEGVA